MFRFLVKMMYLLLLLQFFTAGKSGLILLAEAVVSPPCPSGSSTFLAPNGTCAPAPINAVPTSDGLAWSCVDGTVGTYGLRKYILPCTSYSFSSTLGNAAPCAPYASADLSEGYDTYGWCVSCQTPGNCPGAWAQADLGFVGSVAGIYVSGRSGFCNFPLTLMVKTSADGDTWVDVDGGYVFSTGMALDYRCSMAASSYMVQKPLATIRFASPLMARYVRVYPLTHTGFPIWNTYGAYYAWWMCMQFEPLGVSDASSKFAAVYPFTNAETLAQGLGGGLTSSPPFTATSWTSALGGGLLLGIGQVAYSPYIDFSEFSEFTLTYWTSVNSYSCVPSAISFGLVDPSGKIFFGVAPCYGTSYMKITFDGTRSFNGYGWNQDSGGKNFQILHGRRSTLANGTAARNFFWFGQGGNVDASNGMSGVYEIFNLPQWPSKLRLSFGSPGHKHVIKMHDVRLYRDSAVTGVVTSVGTGSVPFDAAPTTTTPILDSCAICQPGFYCTNNQVFACPPNSSAGFRATSITQCVCYLGLYKDAVLGCRACRTGFYCPNQNTELPCTVTTCPGFTYQSATCNSSSDRVCSACPTTTTPLASVAAACICPANAYNNGTGLGCSQCPANAVSPANSYGLSSCTCVAGYFSFPTMDNVTGKMLALECKLCSAGTYSLANTAVCFPYPANAVVSEKSPLGFYCPRGYHMPTDVPVRLNASTGFPTRPGLIYWSFESKSFSAMRNEWGNYTPVGGVNTPPRIFPDVTTADIQALNPNVKCKFGARCALIGGTASSVYAYPFKIPSFTMPAAGISVSYWFRVNSCQNCGSLGTPVIGQESFNFAGVSAKHAADTNLMLAIVFTYNSISTLQSDWSVFGTYPTYGTYDTTMSSFKDKWHHHLFTFLPGGNFYGYLDGVLKVQKNYNKEFPSTVSGTFFMCNYYNGMVDDFAIFEGDIAPYLSNLQTKPANQALDGTGIAAVCIPCFNGMYCDNNTATTCPNNKTSSLPLSGTEADCQCNEAGKSGSGNFTDCTSLCPANSYCLGSGYPPQSCPENQISSTNASLVSHCKCPLPFNSDYLGNCICPIIITQKAPSSSNDKCTCSDGYTGNSNDAMTITYPSLYGCGTSSNPSCKVSYLGSTTYYLSYLLDSPNPEVYGTCTAVELISPATSPNSFIRIDLGDIYFIQNITFASGCHNTWQGQLAFGLNAFTDTSTIKYIYGYPSTVFSNYLDPKVVTIPEINTFSRYIFIRSNASSSYTSPISYINVNAFVSSCAICPAGYYCPTKLVSDKRICPAGYYCQVGSVAPTPCGYGKWSLSGATVCISCPANSNTTVPNASNYQTQCICYAGFSGMANNLEPQYQTFSKTNFSNDSIPVSAVLVINSGGVYYKYYKDLALLWDGAPVLSYYGSKYSNLGVSNMAAGPLSWVEYDMGKVIPISKIVAIPALDRSFYGSTIGFCYVSFVLSTTGEFAGEEITILPVQCSSPSVCTGPDAPNWFWANLGFTGMPDISTWGYWAEFNVVNARYVRWYLNFGQGTIFQQLSIYQCQGSTCFSCAPCALNSYCPGTQINETYACPNSTYTFVEGWASNISKGAASISQCQCPLNAAFLPGTTQCACNAGYYYQQNTSYKTSHIGWQCAPCPSNTTSLPGALNYTDCFCSAGLQSISLNPPTLPDAAMTRFTEQPPFRLTITTKPGYNMLDASRNPLLLNDGANTGNANSWKYPCPDATWTPWVTPPYWVQYDLNGIFPITKIIARPYVDTRLYSSLSLQISNTGNFSGEETVVYSCGLATNSWCPAPVTNVGFTASFVVKFARYVRWYMGASNSNPAYPYFLQLSVYYATMLYNCSNCVSNSYCPSKVINQTFKCPNNTFSLTGAKAVSDCVCPANAAVGSTTLNCTCNAGYYLTLNASAPLGAGWQCNACPANLMSLAGSKSLSDCTCMAGYYPTNPLVSLQDCTLCPLNTYCPYKAIGPVPCPAGTTTNNQQGVANVCSTPCPPGFYCPGDAKIYACPSGTYSTGGAQAASCTACEPGYFCNSTLLHQVCPSGFYCPAGTVNPIPCASTTYSLGGVSVCTTCEFGFYCPTVFGRVQCPVLYYCPGGSTTPIPCDSGLYSCAGSGICAIQCPPGGYCPGNGTVIPCPLGSFSNGGAGVGGCTPCPEGFFCDFSLQLTAAGCV